MISQQLKQSNIEILFDRLKRDGVLKGYKNYRDYLLQKRLEKVRDVNAIETVSASSEFMIGQKKQRPLFGIRD